MSRAAALIIARHNATSAVDSAPTPGAYRASDGVSADGASNGRGGRGALSPVNDVSLGAVWSAAAGCSGISECPGFGGIFFRAGTWTPAV
jgi:hypothetical protein